MYLLPSAKDKRLVMLRQAARKHGLMVKITSVPKLDPTAQERVTAGGKTLEPKYAAASYELPLNTRLRGVGEVMLVRMPDAPTVPLTEALPGWALGADSDQAFWQRLTALPEAVDVIGDVLASLPEGSLGCSLNDRYVSCYWTEKLGSDEDTVAGIEASLMRLKGLLCEHFTPADEAETDLKDG